MLNDDSAEYIIDGEPQVDSIALSRWLSWVK